MAIIYSYLSPFSMSTGRVNFRVPLGFSYFADKGCNLEFDQLPNRL